MSGAAGIAARSTICIAEDRLFCEPAIRLLLLSLNAYGDGREVNVFFPPAGPAFADWAARFRAVRVRPDRFGDVGWNVKPLAVLRLLGEGYREVVWIDSDVIVARPVASLLFALPDDTLLVSEAALGRDRWDGNAVRARLWGQAPGRSFGSVLSTGVFRATAAHGGLMERWAELLGSEQYMAAQRASWAQRPLHMLGDQDVLTALLASSQFSAVPIRILRRGSHIAQFAGSRGFSIADRMRSVATGGPAFIHAGFGGGKPWSEPPWPGRARGPREFLRRQYLDASPYTVCALRFRDALGGDDAWMEPRTRIGRAARWLAAGRPALAGLPWAVAADGAKAVSVVLARRRKRPDLLATGGYGWAG